eukprot:CAMPEP_0197245396 /NCGR_PEP_ID=MMETSP1429-20130617/10199_1 /TAXON_ID=49237 /ORGANISM="Chaetoceros  sp., Strain UNC1202" /LENGTH=194 /DNA_ID=CAMNT_0042705881 /DNA_START=53 /DNA_END=637 /DNA_ORIENTATION=+
MTSNPTASTIVPTRMLVQEPGTNDGLECSVHNLPKPLLREFRHVFQDEYLKRPNADGGTQFNSTEALELIAIPTNQRAREDLVAIGDHIEQEKDRLLNVFIAFGRDICENIRAKGYWADFIDPCSGLPMITQSCNKVYSEVDGMECLLNFKSYNAGFCKILTHPVWGSAVYPATIFAHCPANVAAEILNAYPSC